MPTDEPTGLIGESELTPPSRAGNTEKCFIARRLAAIGLGRLVEFTSKGSRVTNSLWVVVCHPGGCWSSSTLSMTETTF